MVDAADKMHLGVYINQSQGLPWRPKAHYDKAAWFDKMRQSEAEAVKQKQWRRSSEVEAVKQKQGQAVKDKQ